MQHGEWTEHFSGLRRNHAGVALLPNGRYTYGFGPDSGLGYWSLRPDGAAVRLWGYRQCAVGMGSTTTEELELDLNLTSDASSILSVCGGARAGLDFGDGRRRRPSWGHHRPPGWVPAVALMCRAYT